jgi:serine/threonine protein kinase
VNNIIHRDLKPENLVLDDKGYVRLTDLGIARVWKAENSADTSGTPGYMAPEVMCHQNHGIAVDYFALGVIAYEFMLGRVFIQFITATLLGQIPKGNQGVNTGEISLD